MKRPWRKLNYMLLNLSKRMRVPRTILIALILSVFLSGYAESNESRMWQVSLTGGLYINNEQAWQLEPSVSWHLHKYIGIGMGIEFTSQYNQPSRTTVIDGHEAELVNNERNVVWIIFKPYVTFKSPAVWKSADEYMRLWFQADPGISLACPFRNSLTYEMKEFQGAVSNTVDYRRFSNKDLQWFYWNARASVNFAIDRFIIGAGYSISNLDYYSGRRNVTLANGQKFYVPKKELSQSIFLSLGYTF